jgi:hypothetical protein
MKSIKKELTAATCTLLSQHPGSALALENAWEIDSSYLRYSEADDRVTVNKFTAKAGGDVSDRDRVNLTAVLDTMSGSTPSGAVKQSTPGFTGASGGGGGGSTESNADALAKFDDTRTGLSLSWTHSHDNNWEMVYGGAISVENDYRSYTGSVVVNKDIHQKATRLTLGVAGTTDEVFRVGDGNTPVPLSPIGAGLFYGQGEKDTVDVIAGVTRVINRRTLGQLNLTYSVSNGYLTDPYKVFSVVDINSDIAYDSFYESRPSSRERTSITGHINHQTYPANNILSASYRYYTDDWDVDSHTFQIGHQITMSGGKYWEPRIRLYHQTAAFFYQNEYFAEVDGNPNAPSIPDGFPEFISADYRLDEFYSVTPELQFGTEIGGDDHLRMRVAYMYQEFKNSEFDTNAAAIFQIAYNKRF